MTVTPAAFSLAVSVIAIGAYLFSVGIYSYQARLVGRIAELEAQNLRLQQFVASKEREKNQMVALADARSEELWKELESRDREFEALWQLVGQKPETRRRRSLASSRGGRRDASVVKRRYHEIYTHLDSKDTELKLLEEAALRYRQRQELKRRLEVYNNTPSRWPCEGELSSGFGNRIHPVYGYLKFHSGVDITAPWGTPIYACAAGRVVEAGWLGGYGRTVEIQHRRNLKTLYGHCCELLVSEGEWVKKGQLIARVGSTGVSTGPHVHYEVKIDGHQVDPMPYLREEGAHLAAGQNVSQGERPSAPER